MPEAVPLLLKLVVAHVFGDFVFQSEGDARNKRRAAVLLRHAAAHAICLGLVLLSEPAHARPWAALGLLLLAHVGIDRWTASWEDGTWRRLALDQALHLMSILVAVSVIRPAELGWITSRLADENASLAVWGWLMGAGVTIWVGGVTTRMVVAPYARALERAQPGIRPGLADAGRLIGMLERTVIFLAVTMRMEALVGFVIAAKAILRLPEARERQSHALAEYYLIGSLASLAWGVLFASWTRVLFGEGFHPPR